MAENETDARARAPEAPEAPEAPRKSKKPATKDCTHCFGTGVIMHGTLIRCTFCAAGDSK